MFRTKKKEPEIELCELWCLNHTLAKIISRYLKEFIEASSLSGSTPGSHYQKDPENCWSLWEADLWLDRDTHQKNTENRDRFTCQWRATSLEQDSSNAGGLQRR